MPQGKRQLSSGRHRKALRKKGPLSAQDKKSRGKTKKGSKFDGLHAPTAICHPSTVPLLLRPSHRVNCHFVVICTTYFEVAVVLDTT